MYVCAAMCATSCDSIQSVLGIGRKGLLATHNTHTHTHAHTSSAPRSTMAASCSLKRSEARRWKLAAWEKICELLAAASGDSSFSLHLLLDVDAPRSSATFPRRSGYPRVRLLGDPGSK